MSLPFTLNSPQEWLDKIPTFLISLNTSTEYGLSNNTPVYIASKLVLYFNHSPQQFGRKIVEILTNASDTGKFVLLKILLRTSPIWADLIKTEGVQPALTELALTTDKVYSIDAIDLSKKIDENSAVGKLDIFSEESIPALEEEPFTETKMFEESPLSSTMSDHSDYKAKKKARISSPPGTSEPKSQPLPSMRKESKLEPQAPVVAPPAPAPESERSVGSVPPPPMREILTEEDAFEVEDEEEFSEVEKLSDDTLLIEKKEKSEPISEPFSSEIPIKDSKQIFTHVHYYNRMNSHKIYPFTVSLSSVAKKVRGMSIGNILSGEREKETQAEFELDAHTRQIMVEPLISGCLIQPNFQYVDPDKLPQELTFYITPLVESGLQATRLQGFLIIKSELGDILQKLPLSDISVVSNRVSKIAAVVGAIGGASLPVLDFLFPLGLQNAVTDQLTYTLPEIANSINIRDLLTVGQISIFVTCIGFGLLWYWKKGRSKLAPREKLAINI
jgi:hypothetical protein